MWRGEGGRWLCGEVRVGVGNVERVGGGYVERGGWEVVMWRGEGGR